MSMRARFVASEFGAPRIVLITGAAGRIGGYLRSGLPPLGYQLRLLDRIPIPGEPAAITADICDRPRLSEAARGVGAIVHLAAEHDPEAPFEAFVKPNIEGMHCVLETARELGVPRIVFASSNHANGFSQRRDAVVAGSAADRPDGFYGVSKLYGEALARLYVDRYGMQAACIRIGSCFDRPTTPRMLGTWLSPGDVTRLVAACLSSPTLRYSVMYGISRNTRRWWDLEAASTHGYQPTDDAEAFADEVLAPYFGQDPGTPDEPQGGDGAWVARDLC